MPKMFVKQRVRDIGRWREAFARMAAAGEEYGLSVTGMYRATEPNTVIVTLDVDDIARAEAFAHSEALRLGRQQADAQGEADYWIAESDIE